MLRVIREARPTWIIGENVAGIVNMALDQVHTDLEAEGYEVESLIIPACAVDAPHRRDRVWIVGHAKLDGLTAAETGQGLLNQSKESGGEIEEREPAGAGGSSADVAYTKCDAERSAHRGKERERERGWQEPSIGKGNQMGGNATNCGKDVADSVRLGGSSGISEQKQWKEGKPKIAYNNSCGESKKAVWLPEPSVGRLADGIPNRVAKLRGLGNAIVPQVAYQIIKGIRELL